MNINISTAYTEALSLRNKYKEDIDLLKKQIGKNRTEKQDLTIQILEQVVLDIEINILNKWVSENQ